jgi:hypothetical protein
MGFERLTIHDVDWPPKQFGYVPLETAYPNSSIGASGSNSIRISMSRNQAEKLFHHQDTKSPRKAEVRKTPAFLRLLPGA